MSAIPVVIVVDPKLLARNLDIESRLRGVANSYKQMHDARWMFARAHQLITTQINRAIKDNPHAFRNPDQLIRFNISFATAFLAAVADMTSPPWRKAFTDCAVAEASTAMTFPREAPLDPMRPISAPTTLPHSDDPSSVKVCAIAMANAHINTDIVNSLKTIGCIDKNDYGNMLVFVERGARQSIIEMHGRLSGPIYNWLKEMLLPLDRFWRNSVYAEVCHVPVPSVEKAFVDAIDAAEQKMTDISPAVH